MRPYYQENGITIYHGDCREILPSLPNVDLVLTDPPYGIGESGKRNSTRGKGFGSKTMAKHNTRRTIIPPTNFGDFNWDAEPPPRWLFGLLAEKAEKQIIWGGNYFPLPPSSCWLVWDKDNSGDFADCELAWTNLDMAVRKFKWRWNGMLQENMGQKEPRMYPAQKPLALMKWCLVLAGHVTSMIDPFMGSGSSLRAAKDTGVGAIGIDTNEQACEIAASRLTQEVLQFA